MAWRQSSAASEAAAEAASAPRPLRQRGALVALAFDAWQWQRALVAAAAERASEVDVVLLLGGLAVSQALGAIIVASGSGSIAAAASASSGSNLALLSLSRGLLWSLGAPVVDILTVSIFSHMLSGLSAGQAHGPLYSRGKGGLCVTFPARVGCCVAVHDSQCLWQALPIRKMFGQFAGPREA